MLNIWENPMHPLSFRLEVAIGEIEKLRSLYFLQCECAEVLDDKRRAEAERKADATLLARIAELEKSLATVNARLAGEVQENQHLRGLLLWVLYQLQGGYSRVGQPIRKALGIGPGAPLTEEEIVIAKLAAERDQLAI